MEDIFVHVSGYDKNSGLLVENNSTILQFIVVDKAMLSLSSQIVKLQGAEDDTLSVGQQFMMEALIENNGTASTMGNGQVFIEDLDSNPYISRDYSQGPFSDTLSFNVGDPVSWNLKVDQLPAGMISNLLLSLENILDVEKHNPGKLNYKLHKTYSRPREIFKQIFNLTGQLSISSTEISVRIKSTPIDENSNQSADTINASQIKTLFIENKASLELTEISMPDTVSTGQNFSLTVKATPSPNIDSSKAIVQLPASFAGSTNLVAEFNQDSLATFNIEVPTSVDGLAAQETLWVIIQGEDENSGLPALVSLPALKVLNIQLRPKLAMNYEIKSPASAVIKNVLSHGQSILIEVWADTLQQMSNLNYANMKDTGSIVLDQRLFSRDNFQMIENEIYEKTFTRFKERLSFIVRAPREDITTNINLNFNHLPKDKNSSDVLVVDVDSGTVNIPITVNEKEIIVSKIDSLVENTNFTRGQEGNVLFAFEISNEGYLDSLFMNGLELTFRAHDDTSKLTELAVVNMLQSIQIINYEQYKTILGKTTTGEPKIYADYQFDNQQPTNPLKIDFNDTAMLSPDSVEQILVITKFRSNAATRSFRTVLSSINAYDDNPDFMVAIVDEEGRPIE
ncbi:MAG: hypothetical protein KAS18_09420, partial [Calditrichia bacterium]|nr:hypothetical protein [Calditrichia bacterium]